MIPQTSLNALEFTKVLELIAQYANSDATRNAVLSITPISSKNEIEKRFACVKEILKMFSMEKPLRLLPFMDIFPFLRKVRIEDAIPEPTELVWLMDFLSACHAAAKQLKGDASLVALNELIVGLTGNPDLLNILKNTIDRDGNILDSASPLLAELRGERRRLETRIRKKLEEIMQTEATAVFLQDTFVTQRSGRWVIPVRMDSKGQVSGVVHDVSRTGETVFVEPIAIISLSNEYENISADEKAEVMRILRELGSRIRETADLLEEDLRILIRIDLINSIACLAQRFSMKIPEINEENILNLVKAKHPLLLYAASQKNRVSEIIPIDVNLGNNKRVMVITGPNAGGKTVAIKSIGLLSVMALSGIPIPADASTTIPLFHNLLVDIGDSQSIADNLSTFTAHLANMMEFLNKADNATLVLIDELGTGTDPEEGAALACAILQELTGRGSLVFATTHLTDIKVFAHRDETMLNASMEFDNKTHVPLYKLRTGEPGQSFALETARRYGMSDSLINSAKMLLGKRKADLENLIHDLDEKRRHYEDALQELTRQSAELTESKERIAQVLKDVEKNRKEILANAYKKATDIIVDIKKKMHEILEDIKKSDQTRARELVKETQIAQETILQQAKEYEDTDIKSVSMDELKEGYVIFVKSIGYDATILKLLKKKDRIRVKAGSVEMEVPLSDVGMKTGKILQTTKPRITALSEAETAADIKPAKKPHSKGKNQLKRHFTDTENANEVNLIGMHVDEAFAELEKFLNHAALASISNIIVIHGIGAGILSKAVREYLTGHPLVNNYRSGEQIEGGAGVTIVSLK